MALTNAERQRRYRAHRAGDHSTCDPLRCNGETPVTAVTSQRPPRLAQRGRRLWDDMKGAELPAGRRELLEEACRLVDRLDQLDAALRGRAPWLEFRLGELSDVIEVTVVVDGALSEARQQQLALKQVLAELRAAAPKVEAPAAPATTVTPGGAPGVAGVASLAERIAAKRRAGTA